MRSSSSVGLALFTVSTIVLTARGNGVLQSFLPRFGLFRRRDDGQFYTAESTRGSERWRFIFSTSPDHGEDDDDDDQEEEGDVSSCEVELVNMSGHTLTFCWVSETGTLHHYYPIASVGAIKDNSVSHCHVEYTHIGHSFVCLRLSSDLPLPKEMKDVDQMDFCFVYRPSVTGAGLRHTLTVSSPTQVAVRVGKIDKELFDSSTKPYERVTIAGFCVCYEEGVFGRGGDGPRARRLLEGDLEEVRRLLPAAACRRLQINTRIYVNENLSFGTKTNPIVGRGACFHPAGGAAWLKKNGCSIEKEGCIELYSIEDYITSHTHWGKGGSILHEFCHAFHNKLVPQGFDNEDIRAAYALAMSKRKYDAVAVHGPQGEDGPQRAYACANAMEFFAELSTAYLFRDNSWKEFNKWYPFNRAQLKTHDPDSYRLIERIWSSTTIPPDTSTLTKAIGQSSPEARKARSFLSRRPTAGSPTRSPARRLSVSTLPNGASTS